MELKVATKEDMEELIILLNTLFSQEVEFEPNKSVQEKGLLLILEDESIGHILVAKDENRICAMVNLLYTVSTALGSRVAILEDMVVLDEYRNKNIGTLLINYAKEFAKEKSCKRITLLTDSNNTNAHEFYKRNGFEESSMIPFRSFL